METIYRKINPQEIDMSVIEEASKILKRGDIVAFHTETVYGLGADALNEDASRKIYAAKGRPSDNPLIVHVSNTEQVKRVVKKIPEAAKKLMDAFWPGPLTIIFNKADVVPNGTTGGLNTVAVRMPSHEVARTLIEYSDVLIAAITPVVIAALVVNAMIVVIAALVVIAAEINVVVIAVKN